MLLLLVPAILAPMVWLLGFTGCDFEPIRVTLDPPVPPTNVTAVGRSASAIDLAWDYVEPGHKFELERYTAGETGPHVIATTPPHATSLTDMDGLEPGTAYFYRVRAIRESDGEPSDLSPAALGYTFGETFCAVPGLPCGMIPTPQAGLEGFCIVQRIEPPRLLRSGARVILTLHGGAGSLTLDQISISQPAAVGNPYDSGTDLTLVTSPVVLPANTAVALAAFAYDLDRTAPLLIAFNVSPVAGLGNVRFLSPVPAGEASMFFRPATAEAMTADRLPSAANPAATPYNPSPSIYLVEKIEVATA